MTLADAYGAGLDYVAGLVAKQQLLAVQQWRWSDRKGGGKNKPPTSLSSLHKEAAWRNTRMSDKQRALLEKLEVRMRSLCCMTHSKRL